MHKETQTRMVVRVLVINNGHFCSQFKGPVPGYEQKAFTSSHLYAAACFPCNVLFWSDLCPEIQKFRYWLRLYLTPNEIDGTMGEKKKKKIKSNIIFKIQVIHKMHNKVEGQ